MAKMRRNPLTFGLPSHIYLLCYFSPQNGYSLGKRIYQPVKGLPPTSKIYPWLKKLEGIFLKKTKQGYEAILDQLISEIKNKINSHNPLSKTEEAQLVKLLQSREFRDYAEGWYNRDRKYEQYGWSGVVIGRKEEGLNALRLISETIGMLGVVSIIRSEYNNLSLEEDEKYIEKLYRNQSNDESWIQEQMKGIKQYNEVIKHFEKYSAEFLLKLSVLYPHSDVMLKVEKNLYIQKHMNPESFGWKKVQ